MDLPIHLHHQAVLDALVNFVPEVRLGRLLGPPQQQHALEIGQVLNAGQLWNAGTLHHAEQSNEQSSVFAQDLVGLGGYLQEPGEQPTVLPAQNVHKVRRQNERHPVPCPRQASSSGCPRNGRSRCGTDFLSRLPLCCRCACPLSPGCR